MTLLKILFFIFLLLILVWYSLSMEFCRRSNGVKDLSSIFCFMFDSKYRTLSILRQRFLQECGKDVNPKDYDAWKKGLNLEEVVKFSYQLRFIISFCKSGNK